MADYGNPASYLTVTEGTTVYASDGEDVGSVEHVLAVPEEDIFDGIVIKTDSGFRFVDAPEVGDLYERGVLLKIASSEVEQLPEPSENPGVMEVDPDDTVRQGLGEKLSRAWDKISGKY